MAGNQRIYSAIHALSIKTEGVGADYTEVHGVQSVNMTTNFNLEQVFELGQLALYENIESLPDVQITTQKVLDGYPLMYCLATKDATTPTLSGRQNSKAQVALGIFSDTLDSSTGVPSQHMTTSGMYISSVTYSFPLDGPSTEEVTFVGNNKVWRNDPRMVISEPAWSADLTAMGQFNNNDAPIGSGGISRREDLLFSPGDSSGLGVDTNGMVDDPDICILPPDIVGITSSGTHDLSNEHRARLASITVSVDLGRETINELGRRGPYHRFITFPTEVTCEVQVTSTSGDFISAVEEGILSSAGQCSNAANLTERTIRIATCEGTRISLGAQNKLSSVTYAGGDAGGGNVTVTYNYSTFNDFTIMHLNDPNANFAWSSRSTYLIVP